MRADPRESLDVLDKDGWYTHVGIIGHVSEIYEDADMADIDRIARHYIGSPYSDRERGRFSALIAVDSWHGWGELKDNG
jgi:hypothetical protein